MFSLPQIECLDRTSISWDSRCMCSLKSWFDISRSSKLFVIRTQWDISYHTWSFPTWSYPNIQIGYFQFEFVYPTSVVLINSNCLISFAIWNDNFQLKHSVYSLTLTKTQFRKYEYTQGIAPKVPIELLYLQGPHREALLKSHLYLTKLNKRKWQKLL